MCAGTLAQHGSLHPAAAAGPPQQTAGAVKPHPAHSPQHAPTVGGLALLCNSRSSPGAGHKGKARTTPLWRERRTDADTGPCRPCLGWVAETCCISCAPNLGPINHDFCSTPIPLDLYSPQHVSPKCDTAQRFSASCDGIFGFPAELFSLPPGMRSSSQS